MKNLKDLIDIASPNKIKQIEIFSPDSDQKTKIHKLYKGIVLNEWEDEDEASFAIYGSNKNRKYYFNRLKANLHSRLINTIFFINRNQNYSASQSAYYLCYKNMVAVKILLANDARDIAIDLAQKTIKKAAEFEFTDISLELSIILRRDSAHKGLNRQFVEYNCLVSKNQELYLAELMAEEYYMSILSEAANKMAYQSATIIKAKNYVKELNKINENSKTQKFKYFEYLTIISVYEMESNFEAILHYSQLAIEELSNPKRVISSKRIASFILRKTHCHLYFGAYREAEIGINQYKKNVKLGSYNWYLIHTYEIRLAILKLDYQRAYESYMTANQNTTLNSLEANIIEIWKIHEAFIYFLIQTGKVTPNSRRALKKFRISKFMNEVPIFSKDKRGYNTCIIILQILFLLQEKKYDSILERTDALQIYTHRYLKKDNTFRSNCFIKMLIELTRASFHKAAVLRKTAKLRKRLNEQPISIANQSAEMEIIPYEQLWDIILEGLDNKFH